MLKSIFFLVLVIASNFCQGQNKKVLNATRISEAPKVDGVLDDEIWQKLPTYGQFNMFEPGNEGIIPETYKTEVKFAYDDKAVYIGAFMADPNPENISSQFSQRDAVNVQADVFTVALNTYNDGINETRFYVTSAGTVGDSRVSINNQDFGYDTVFECRVSKDEKGWYAEYKIPYNALRFPEAEIQNWSVNFYRRLINQNQTHTWNRIENSVGNETQYNGLITNLKNINPPIRLTFFPFAQGQISNFDSKTEIDFSAGMDIKYGLSDSFTLDMTLVPDFGQAAFDEVSLNLGPFEQTFDENRQFFTEGIELFNKANIFYSRRIGSAPTGNIGKLDTNEVVTEFPVRVNLLNALKISGRTQSELGIGFFNAITENTFASVFDSITFQSRKVLVEPLSNYNVFVLDQQFNGNSSISLINTNVTREGHFRDANTTAFTFSIADRGDHYRSSGRAIMSNINDVNGNTSGFLSELDIFRIKGNFRYRIGHDFANETYNINDFGISFQNNFNDFVAGASYQIFEPTKIFNNYKFEFTARHRRRYRPSLQTGNSFNFDTFFVLKSRFAFGVNTSFNSKNEDYFEPRVAGRYVTFPKNLGGNAFVSSDYRKKFAYDISVGYRDYFETPQQFYYFEISPRYRFSNKFLMIVKSEINKNSNSFGFVGKKEKEIFFGQRDITEIENSITASYNFDPYKAIDLRFRNFWGKADYSDAQFTTLNTNGSRSPTNFDIEEYNPNSNFNIWNLDLSFRWRFAPGSEATLLYRNQIFNFDRQSTLNYSESLDNLFSQPQLNTLSLRIRYFIDYNNITTLFHKES